MNKRRIILLTALVLLVAGATQALASGRDVIDDCTDDEVLAKTYTQKEYRDALKQLPADADQYGNCRDIIARAQDAAVTKGSKGKTTKPGTTTATSGATTPGRGSTAEPSTKPASEQLATASAQDRAAADEAAREPSAAEVVPSAVGAANGTDAG
jgi:hypothetical protein